MTTTKTESAESKGEKKPDVAVEKTKREACAFNPDTTIIKPKNVTDRGLVTYLRGETRRYELVQTAKNTGLVTNGKVLFRATDKDIVALAKVPDDKDARAMPADRMEAMLKYVKDDYVKAKVTGTRKTGEYGECLHA